MKITESERVICVDVDDTLIMHVTDVHAICPAERAEIYDMVENTFLIFRKNLPMIRLVKEEYTRGAHIKVWSRGGFEWARTVVASLGLRDHVHEVLSKPTVYFDDKPSNEWMKDRVWISPDTTYKINTTKQIPKGE